MKITCRATSACAAPAGWSRGAAWSRRASWVHNTRALGTSMNGVTIHQAGTRNAGELKLGVDATLNANVNLGAA